MNWEIVSSTGEWAGAFFVAITLIYLASQIRLQNRIARYEARASIIDGFNQQLTNNSFEQMAAYLKGRNSPEVCKEVELALFQNGLRIYTNNTHKAYQAYRSRLLPETEWLTMAAVYAAEISTPGGVIYRRGNESSAPEFYRAVDQVGDKIAAELDLRAT